jgi:hypothetical protein
MKGDKRYISPIMTNSESIWQFGSNAYGKPATALNILRETVMDLNSSTTHLRSTQTDGSLNTLVLLTFLEPMEDASAVDLDWFWRVGLTPMTIAT